MKTIVKILGITALLIFAVIAGYFTLEYLSEKTIYIKGD